MGILPIPIRCIYFFSSLSLKNSIVKRVSLGVVMDE